MSSLGGFVALVLLAAARPGPGRALDPIDPVVDADLRALDGGRQHVAGKGAAASVLVFVRAGHQHSLDALRELASREGQLRGVRWVAIASGDTSLREARELAAAAGVRMPLLLDDGDALYGKLAVKLHPTVFILDRGGRLAAREPFRQINYLDRVVARIRFTLGEITQAELARAEDPESSADRPDEAGIARRQALFARRLLEVGQLAQAMAEVQKSLMTAPTGEAYVLQGKILARQGKCRDAAHAFDVALRLEPRNGEAADGKKSCGP